MGLKNNNKISVHISIYLFIIYKFVHINRFKLNGPLPVYIYIYIYIYIFVNKDALSFCSLSFCRHLHSRGNGQRTINSTCIQMKN